MSVFLLLQGEITDQDFKAYFDPFGDIEDAVVCTVRVHRSRSFCQFSCCTGDICVLSSVWCISLALGVCFRLCSCPYVGVLGLFSHAFGVFRALPLYALGAVYVLNICSSGV